MNNWYFLPRHLRLLIFLIDQAMLRKTSHQRNSMKRTPVYDSYGTSQPSNLRSKRNDAYDSNVVYRSGGGKRAESPEWSPNEMVRMSEKYGREGAWGGDDGGDRNGYGVANISESVTAELAPGIVVEGYVADL